MLPRYGRPCHTEAGFVQQRRGRQEFTNTSLPCLGLPRVADTDTTYKQNQISSTYCLNPELAEQSSLDLLRTFDGSLADSCREWR